MGFRLSPLGLMILEKTSGIGSEIKNYQLAIVLASSFQDRGSQGISGFSSIEQELGKSGK